MKSYPIVYSTLNLRPPPIYSLKVEYRKGIFV